MAGMKLVLGALVSALPALVNVCILLMAVFLVFAIMGVSLFMGKFYSCNDDGKSRDECHGSHEHEDYLVPTKWSNPSLDGFGEYSFDNLGAAVLCLFEAGAQLEP